MPEFVTGVSGSSIGDTAASHSLLALCGGQSIIKEDFRVTQPCLPQDRLKFLIPTGVKFLR